MAASFLPGPPPVPRRSRVPQVTSNIALDYDVTEFKLVTFLDIPESFDVDDACKRSEMIVHYVIGKTLYASRHDFVGLYKVGWRRTTDSIYQSGLATLPRDYTPGKQLRHRGIFPGDSLPKDNINFYQFCYITEHGKVCGVSTPFQFKKRRSHVPDWSSTNSEISDWLALFNLSCIPSESTSKQAVNGFQLKPPAPLLRDLKGATALDVKSSSGDVNSSSGDAKSSNGVVKPSNGDVKSSNGDVKSNTGDSKPSTGDVKISSDIKSLSATVTELRNKIDVAEESLNWTLAENNRLRSQLDEEKRAREEDRVEHDQKNREEMNELKGENEATTAHLLENLDLTNERMVHFERLAVKLNEEFEAYKERTESQLRLIRPTMSADRRTVPNNVITAPTTPGGRRSVPNDSHSAATLPANTASVNRYNSHESPASTSSTARVLLKTEGISTTFSFDKTKSKGLATKPNCPVCGIVFSSGTSDINRNRHLAMHATTDRICPYCRELFSCSTPQAVFEEHVNRHNQ